MTAIVSIEIDLTPREAFKKMVEHFKRPDTTLAGDMNGCNYRDDNGNACAVGCLISDEDVARLVAYDVHANSEAAGRLSERGLLTTSDETLEFLNLAQKAHDSSLFRGEGSVEFIHRLEGVALGLGVIVDVWSSGYVYPAD